MPAHHCFFVCCGTSMKKKYIKVVTNDILSAPALSRFKHLSAIVESTSTPQTLSSLRSQLDHYLMDLKQPTNADALKYWVNHQTTYGCLAEMALDILAATASQAYVERIFSICGMLCQGR